MARGGDGEGAAVPGARQGHDVVDRWFETAALGFVPLGAKLRPARPRMGLVPRVALVDSLAKSREPFVLVSAPAGAGKSTALMQWVDADPRPSAWVALDAGDNDPVTFARYLSLAVARVAPLDIEVFELLGRPRPPLGEQVVPRLATALAQAPPFLLVLDDGHLVRRRECWRMVGTLVDALEGDARLVVGTRTDPPLPLSRLRAAGHLAEVGMTELAMREHEASELLRMRGVSMTNGDLRATMAATEGWAAGVYLASLVAETLPPGEWAAHVRGDQVEFARYLTDEVLRQLPAGTRAFMTQTSILDRLCGGVCAAVTGRADSAALLERIAKGNVFVSALDDHGRWYRYHHLFAELLRADLERREPREVPHAHRLAAEWYDAHDDPEAAVRHWLAAGDTAAAVDHAKAACVKVQRQEPGLDLGLVPRLLRLIDAKSILGDPALTLMAGWALGLVAGDRSEQRRWGRAACRVRVDDGPCEAGAASWRSYQALLRAYLAPDGVSKMLEDAELGYRLESDSDGGWRLEAASALGLARYLAGCGDALGLLQSAAEGDWDRGDRAWAWGMISLVHADDGRWQQAAEADYQAVEVELRSNLGFATDDGSPALLAPLLSHARILSRRRDPGTRQFLDEAERYVARMVPQAESMLLLASVVLGQVCLEQDDLARASRWRDGALAIRARYPDTGMLGPRARQLARAIEQRSFGQPLTKAERRVLELLTTHLTVQQIAECLFVSRNTVRTHVQRIHRKLGVTTRTEAVAKARELGLLSTST